MVFSKKYSPVCQMLFKITENRDRGKQLETEETTVQTSMLPDAKDDTLERKLSTKPNEKCTLESKKICISCQLYRWK